MKKKMMVWVLAVTMVMGAQMAFGSGQTTPDTFQQGGTETEQTGPMVPGGVTKFDNGKGKIGPAIYVAHQDMWMIKSVRDLEAMLARLLVPKPYGSLVSQAVKARSTMIASKDKGSGVRLQWTHATWGPAGVGIEGFWTFPQ
jgi:hypothetical protein